MNVLVWDAGVVEKHGSIPEQGDFIEGPNGKELLVTSAKVINKSKVEMKVTPSSDSVYYSDQSDPSEMWSEIDSDFLPGEEKEEEDRKFLYNDIDE